VKTKSRPRRRPNAEVRVREYLLEHEVERLIKAAGDNRHGHRDATMILIGFRHGLRAAELLALKWEAIDFNAGRIHINRIKNGVASVHPLSGRELRALCQLKREQEPESPFVFTSERGAPFATIGFRKMVARLGVAAGFEFPLHPHQLRHAAGYKLARSGMSTWDLQLFMGHKNVRSTQKYVQLTDSRFKGYWRD
jgi:integrase